MIACGLVASIFAVWVANGYLVRVAPHFGQREVIEAFYRDRASPDEPLVAYEMNWKGENFYAGSHVAIFVSSGPPMQRYVESRRADADRTLHFVLEHGRVARLRAEIGPVAAFDVLTSNATNDKFCLVRVVLA